VKDPTPKNRGVLIPKTGVKDPPVGPGKGSARKEPKVKISNPEKGQKAQKPKG